MADRTFICLGENKSLAYAQAEVGRVTSNVSMLNTLQNVMLPTIKLVGNAHGALLAINARREGKEVRLYVKSRTSVVRACVEQSRTRLDVFDLSGGFPCRTHQRSYETTSGHHGAEILRQLMVANL